LPGFVEASSLAEILPPTIDPGLPLQHSLAVYQQLLTEVRA
jgi:hypothetical protein